MPGKVADIDIAMVESFLSERRSHYVNLMKEIEEHLTKLRMTPRLQKKIYTIYSRSSKQSGSELKESWKILRNVQEVRAGTRRIPGETKSSKGEPNPNFAVTDLWDIVGVTIVCVYPSDINALVETINDAIEEENFQALFREPKKDRGYHAYHFALSLPKADFEEIWCEVQIKTLLHDAWGAKTHDLTYKPDGELHPKMKNQMENLGDLLERVDHQSELVKDLIVERWIFDEQKREAARQALVYTLWHKHRPSDSKKGKLFDEIFDDLIKNKNTYADEKFESLLSIRKKIEKLTQNRVHNAETCRLATLLASFRANSDHDAYAMNCLHRWEIAARQEGSEETVKMLTFKGLAFYCLGRIEPAIQAVEDGLKIARASNFNAWITKLLINGADYHAELGNASLGKKLRSDTVSRASVREAKAILKSLSDLSKEDIDQMRARLRDTEGAVYITFGRTEKKVLQGLKLCERAYQFIEKSAAHEDFKKCAKSYYYARQKRAYRRLGEFH